MENEREDMTKMTDANVIDMRETKKKERPRRDSVFMAVGIVLMMLAIIFIVSAVLAIAEIKVNDIVLTEVCMSLTALWTVFAAGKFKGTRLRETVRLKNFDISVPLVLLFGGWAMGEIVNSLVGYICCNFMTTTPEESYPFNLAYFITTCVTAPIFEELIFRFGVFGCLKKNLKLRTSVLLSALLFALVHLYNIQGFADVFVGAVLMAAVYYYTGNILYVMLEHSLHNLLCFADLDFNFFGTEVYHNMNGFINASVPWLIMEGIVVALAAVYFVKYFKPRYIDSRADKTAQTEQIFMS